jgi:hypothetical protein
MGIKRYELNETQWVKLAPLLPGKAVRDQITACL